MFCANAVNAASISFEGIIREAIHSGRKTISYMIPYKTKVPRLFFCLDIFMWEVDESSYFQLRPRFNVKAVKLVANFRQSLLKYVWPSILLMF